MAHIRKTSALILLLFLLTGLGGAYTQEGRVVVVVRAALDAATRQQIVGAVIRSLMSTRTTTRTRLQ